MVVVAGRRLCEMRGAKGSPTSRFFFGVLPAPPNLRERRCLTPPALAFGRPRFRGPPTATTCREPPVTKLGTDKVSDNISRLFPPGSGLRPRPPHLRAPRPPADVRVAGEGRCRSARAQEPNCSRGQGFGIGTTPILGSLALLLVHGLRRILRSHRQNSSVGWSSTSNDGCAGLMPDPSVSSLRRLKPALRRRYFNPPSHQSARAFFKAAAAFSSSASVA